MNYMLPQYIITANINSPLINYAWYDPSPGKSFSSENVKASLYFVDLMKPTSLRAKIALMIGIHEWVLGRFNHITSKELPYQMAEASFCANIDVKYVPYFDLDFRNYIGPIDRALFYSIVCLHNVIFVSDNIYDLDDFDDEEKDPEYFYSGDEWIVNLRDIISLTFHILPSEKIEFFKTWLNGVVFRLIQLYTVPELYPLDNLFGHEDQKDWLGDYVAREVLDLDTNYNPNKAVEFCNSYLKSVNYTNNPLLVSPDELKGKIDYPYQL